MKVFVDYDILFKGACFGLLSELISAICTRSDSVSVLGSARFVVSRKIQRSKLSKGCAVALETLVAFLGRTHVLEPSGAELQLAADLELAAQEAGLNLDTGESQLSAMLVLRTLSLLLTGDKRAITSVERLLDYDRRLLPICGKVMCLEQVFVAALTQERVASLRRAVCGEPEIDTALAICFSCRSASVATLSITQGLQSYIDALRRLASRVLAP